MKGSRIIVRQLPKYLTESAFKDRFSEFGTVTDCRIIFKGERNRQFGFVGFREMKSAEHAVKSMNGAFIGTSKILVSYAKTKDQVKSKRGKEIKQSRRDRNSKKKPAKDLKKGSKITGKEDPKDEENPKNTGKPEDAEKTEKPVEIEEEKVELLGDRFLVKNLPFDVNEDDMRALFSKHGELKECILIRDPNYRSRGFGFVGFVKQSDAVASFEALHNQFCFGRILRMEKASAPRRDRFQTQTQEEINQNKIDQEKSSFKKFKKAELLKKIYDETNWNALFLNPNTILQKMSEKFGLKKTDILGKEVENGAVKLALCETEILQETKKFLEDQGLDVSIFERPMGQTERSISSFLVKNIPAKITK